jgi:hypothetical protein
MFGLAWLPVQICEPVFQNLNCGLLWPPAPPWYQGSSQFAIADPGIISCLPDQTCKQTPAVISLAAGLPGSLCSLPSKPVLRIQAGRVGIFKMIN